MSASESYELQACGANLETRQVEHELLQELTVLHALFGQRLVEHALGGFGVRQDRVFAERTGGGRRARVKGEQFEEQILFATAHLADDFILLSGGSHSSRSIVAWRWYFCSWWT